MNKRIKVLAEQAGWMMGDEVEGFNTRLEKFAELIVRKCMDVAKYHTPDTEECEYTWLIHNKIAKYFGVEE